MSANPEVEQAIVSKIEALFRQANHPNTGQAEREAFQAKALALMTKHRIESVGTIDETEEPANHLFGTVKGSYARAHHQIIMAVCKMYGCRTYYLSSGRAGDPARTVYLFGFKADAARVKALSELFMTDAKSQAARHKSNDPNTTIRWRKSFLMGYASEVAKRYEEAKRLLDQEQADWSSTGSALVLVDRAKRVNQTFDRRKDLHPARQSTARIDAGGFAAGKDAARNSNIGRSRIGGSPRSLTGG